MLYLVTESGMLLARSTESYTPGWQVSIEGQLLTQPLLIGDTLLVAINGGPDLLIAYDPESGAMRWHHPLES